ncbi:MAG: hypothetical protein O7E52_03880 [Candidatus Poribacteria bacterium]|nr:hypothetical protein [Candidatus Poribacteria bacterium]
MLTEASIKSIKRGEKGKEGQVIHGSAEKVLSAEEILIATGGEALSYPAEEIADALAGA